MTDLLTTRDALHDLDAERDRLRQLVEMDRRLDGVVRSRTNEQRQLRLAIGDALLTLAPPAENGVNTGTHSQLEEVAREAGLALETARIYRKVAGWYGRAAREAIDSLDVEVSFSTVRAAVTVPKAEVVDRAAALDRRLDQLVSMARAAAGSENPVVTETGLREALGEVVACVRRPDDVPAPRPAAPGEEYGAPFPSNTGAEPAAEELTAVITSSPEIARTACAALLAHSAGRAEVFARVLSTPGYLSELVSNDQARRTIQQQIRTSAREERDPDDVAMDAAAEADPEVVLARWRAALQRRDAQAVRLLEYDPEEIATRGNEELINAVLKTAQMYSEWGERLAAAARREGPRAG